MTSADLLADGYARVRGAVHDAVRGLSTDQLAVRIDPQANSIAWLAWHLTRVQDDHLAELTGVEQVWTEQGFNDRFALPVEHGDTGFAHTSEEVARVHGVSSELLLAYHDAASDRTVDYVRTLTDDDLPLVVDESWDPPTTLGVRLISILADGLQHAGQAAFIRGVLERNADR